MSNQKTSALRVRVPATSANVGPGFDCFGMALSLHLEVDARQADKLTITCEGAAVPLDSTNLVVRTFLDHLPPGTPEPRVALHLRNHIPLARGLGSSATARVAGLALASVWPNRNLDLDLRQLAIDASALEHHPDNAVAAVYGGFCISAAGDNFERVEMTDRPYLLAVPAIEIRTEAARKALPPHLSYAEAVFNLQRSALTAARIAKTRDLSGGVPFEDRLHQSYRLGLDPRLKRAFETLSSGTGVEAAYLSGSGPTVFVLPTEPRSAAATVRSAFTDVGLAVEVMTATADNRGVEVRRLAQ